MSTDRERVITGAFVSIANSLADGFDVVDLLSGLTADCVRLLDVEAAGILLADARGVLHVVAASSERTRNLELFQLQRDEGPCLECFRSGHPVAVPDLNQGLERWPQFAVAANRAGFVSVHAVPMRLRDKVLGSLGLFGARTGVLNDDDLSLAQALAHVASVALVVDKAAADEAVIKQQLQTALTSRVGVEQAKGLLAQLGDMDMETSFAALRKFARDHNQKISDIAHKVVSREMHAQEIIDYAESDSGFRSVRFEAEN